MKINSPLLRVKSLTHEGTGQSFPLYRQKANTGEFSKLKEPMAVEHVKMIAQDAGIGIDGIKIQIDSDAGLIGRNLFGYTMPDGKTMVLYPDAFTNRETLVKTLGHERTHVFQLGLYGTPQDDIMSGLMEHGAWDYEDMWWDYYKQMNGVN